MTCAAPSPTRHACITDQEIRRALDRRVERAEPGWSQTVERDHARLISDPRSDEELLAVCAAYDIRSLVHFQPLNEPGWKGRRQFRPSLGVDLDASEPRFHLYGDLTEIVELDAGQEPTLDNLLAALRRQVDRLLSEDWWTQSSFPLRINRETVIKHVRASRERSVLWQPGPRGPLGI